MRREAATIARSVTTTSVALLFAGLLAASAHGQSVVTKVPPATVEQLASAIVSNDDFITGADFFTGGTGTAGVGSGDPLGGFPLSDASYGILTTGDPALAPTANSSGTSGAVINPAATAGRGGSAFDTTGLEIDLTTPPGASCLVFEYRFFSDEPGGPGSGDAFLAQLDTNTWSLAGTSLSRPGDFAAAAGMPTGVNGTGELALRSDFAAGTTYDAATGFLLAKTPVGPGEDHALYLSIFDAADASVDSAAFVGRLGFTAEDASTCRPPGGDLRTTLPSGVSTVAPLAALAGRAQPLPAGSGAVPRTSVPPDNKFRVLKTTRLANGSLRLRIRVPRQGVLSAAFARRRAGETTLVRETRRTVPRAGTYQVTVRPSKAALQRLRRAGRVRALVRIRFAPSGSVPLTEVRRFTFRRG